MGSFSTFFGATDDEFAAAFPSEFWAPFPDSRDPLSRPEPEAFEVLDRFGSPQCAFKSLDFSEVQELWHCIGGAPDVLTPMRPMVVRGEREPIVSEMPAALRDALAGFRGAQIRWAEKESGWKRERLRSLAGVCGACVASERKLFLWVESACYLKLASSLPPVS